MIHLKLNSSIKKISIINNCKWTSFVQILPLETIKVCMKENIGSLDKFKPSPNVTDSNASCIPPLKQNHIYVQILVDLTISYSWTHFNISLVRTNSPPSLITVLLKIIMDIVLLFQIQENLYVQTLKSFLGILCQFLFLSAMVDRIDVFSSHPKYLGALKRMKTSSNN